MTADTPVRRAPDLRRRRWVLAAIILLVLIAGWWVATPESFRGGAGYGADLDAGDSLYIGHPGQPDVAVSVWHVRANASEGLEVDFSACHPRHDEMIGAVNDLDEYCSAVDPVGFRTPLPVQDAEVAPVPYLVVSVTPTEPGAQWMCGFDVLYRSGLRVGRQHVATNVVVNGDMDAPSPCE
jgi:hypothetical protein